MTEAAPIDRQVWPPDPDRPGYLTMERTRTVQEVFDDLRERCLRDAEYGFYVAVGCNEYFSRLVNGETLWPDGRTVVYAVTGGSEGHYVHVAVTGDGTHETLILGKTFDGWDNAWRFAKRLAEALGV